MGNKKTFVWVFPSNNPRVGILSLKQPRLSKENLKNLWRKATKQKVPVVTFARKPFHSANTSHASELQKKIAHIALKVMVERNPLFQQISFHGTRGQDIHFVTVTRAASWEKIMEIVDMEFSGLFHIERPQKQTTLKQVA